MSEQRHTPYVPADSEMREFTLRALIIGLFMCVILGAANAYLGLRAGMTIAATYPAAVIGMAVLRLMKGSLLEENFARTVGSIGESVAAGAIFTIPAFVILNLWTFRTLTDYLTATALMILGGILGIMFVTMLRRVMVEDPDLPFPESVAASEIHKAGQRGAEAALQLFRGMARGGSRPAPRCLRDLLLLQHLQSRGRQAQGEPGAPRPHQGREDHRRRRRLHLLGPCREPGLHRRGLHHRPRARRAQLRRRPSGVGAVRAAAHLLPGTQPDRPVPPGRRRQRGGSVGRHGRRPVALHRAADRGRRHAGGRLLHPLPDAQEPRRRPQACGGRSQEVGGGPRGDQPHRPRHRLQDRGRGARCSRWR